MGNFGYNTFTWNKKNLFIVTARTFPGIPIEYSRAVSDAIVRFADLTFGWTTTFHFQINFIAHINHDLRLYFKMFENRDTQVLIRSCYRVCVSMVNIPSGNSRTI